VDNPRIEDLRRRVEKDPASIAFAQLGEEYRRAGCLQEAVEVCRAGLALHPGYLSARVTLGRALVELGELDDAHLELQLVLSTAPENLAAIRGLAEIHHRRNELSEALGQYKLALGFACNDPDLQETISDLEQKLGASRGPRSYEGLSYEQVKHELSGQVPSVPLALTPVMLAGTAVAELKVAELAVAELAVADFTFTDVAVSDVAVGPVAAAAPPLPEPASLPGNPEVATATASEHHTVAALNEWLSAIHVTRTLGRS
jgi:tetratricopeptide (TPR) repeat protein